MSVSGGRNDTVMDNRFVNNDAWGVIFVAYPDPGQAVHRRHAKLPAAWARKLSLRRLGRRLLDNTFTHNGRYRNPTNGDFEQLNFESHPSDCFSGNVDTSGTTAGLAASR